MTRFIYTINELKKDNGNIKLLSELGKFDWLISYYFLSKKKDVKERLVELTQDKLNDSIFMLDSGAFSAWNSKVKINLFDYIEFIKEYHSFFTHVITLDVIDNPVNSEVNHLIMQDELKDYGLTLIPAFHSGESFKVLDYFIEKGYKYLGISPNNGWMDKDKCSWFDEVFTNYDFESLGIKTHGLGYTSPDYPLTTTDSTSYIKFAIYGRVFLPTGLPHIFEIEDDTKDEFITSICEDLGITVAGMKVDADNGKEDRIRFNIEAIDRIFRNGKRFVPEVCDTIDLFAGSDFGSIPFNVKTLNEKYQYALSLGKEYTGYL